MTLCVCERVSLGLEAVPLSGVAEDAALVSVLRARSRRSAILEGATSYE